MRHLIQLALVALAGVAWTFLASVLAKTLRDRYGSVPIPPTSPDMWAFISALLLWITASGYLSRHPSLTLIAKVALWLVLPPMAYFFMIMLIGMHMPF